MFSKQILFVYFTCCSSICPLVQFVLEPVHCFSNMNNILEAVQYFLNWHNSFIFFLLKYFN